MNANVKFLEVMRATFLRALCAFVAFVVAFGLLGMAKMQPQRPESLVASILLLVLLAGQSLKLRRLRQAADEAQSSVAVLRGKLDAITSPSMMRPW